MNKNTLQHVLTPLIAIFLIFFIWFGPIPTPYVTTIVISILIFVASYIEYKGKLFSSLGFQRSNFKFKSIFVIAPLVALGLFLFYLFVLIPLATKLTGIPIDYSDFEGLEGNWALCLFALLFIWISAGFGEEIVFRGYFMKQFVKFFGDGKVSIVINIIVFACLFGYLHGTQGITGQIVTGTIGAIIATIFYLRKYDLWFVIAIHGFFDTIALICIYLGLV
ncbi:type II CAAX endopeptidase family protein [uncultured Kordia sp.]|uniref:CPBP family intramembrane glutamic endopeptidase n=1 Tax=uncultured Kordia sp. TaxID=507699 RepID=UPI002607B5D1|nr:type II CAAX endopeptidase family protein [uncultured Kordia sp.]